MIQFDNAKLTVTHKCSGVRQEIDRLEVKRVDFFDSSFCYGSDSIWIWPENWVEFCNWFYAPLQPFEATDWDVNKINTIKWFRLLGKFMFGEMPGLKAAKDLVDSMVETKEAGTTRKRAELAALEILVKTLEDHPLNLRDDEYYKYYEKVRGRRNELVRELS